MRVAQSRQRWKSPTPAAGRWYRSSPPSLPSESLGAVAQMIPPFHTPRSKPSFFQQLNPTGGRHRCFFTSTPLLSPKPRASRESTQAIPSPNPCSILASEPWGGCTGDSLSTHFLSLLQTPETAAQVAPRSPHPFLFPSSRTLGRWHW
jgi:hypothetical protein